MSELKIVLWLLKHKKAVAIVVLALTLFGYVGFLRYSNARLKTENKVLEVQTAQALNDLNVAQESAKAQIAALEQETKDTAARNKALNQIIDEVKNNDEKVDCPMPNFMRNAFGGM